MTTPTQPVLRQLHFGVLLLVSLVVFSLGNIVMQAVRWTDHFEGFMHGVAGVVFYGVIWCLLFLPWSLLIYGLYRWRGWRRLRTVWVLAPAVVVGVTSLADLMVNPVTPSGRFRGFAKTELPGGVQNLHFHFSGGGFVNCRDTYYFETSPGEVNRLIAEMRLREDETLGGEEYPLTSIKVKALAGCPDPSSWQGAKRFWRDGGRWSCELVADATKTKVYIYIRSV